MPITITSLSKRFISGRSRCCALDGVDLHIADREMVALIGPSGSGKSTLLRHISGLVAGDSGGSIAIHGRPVQTDGRIVRDIRGIRAGVGMIFQQFNLVARLSVLDNVLIGALHRQPTWRTLAGIMPRAERVAAMACLDRVGLADRAMQRAGTLSGGQQQRVAIARALLQGARIILADEPVASLDPNSSERVMRILADINREDGVTVVVTLHQVAYARAYCPRTVALQSGRIVFDGETARLDDRRLRAIYDDALDLEDAPATTTPLAPEPESALAAN